MEKKREKKKKKKNKKILEMRNEHKSKWVSLFGPEPILVLLPQSPSLLLGLDVWSKPSTGPSSRVAPHPSSAFVAEADTQITLGPPFWLGWVGPFPQAHFVPVVMQKYSTKLSLVVLEVHLSYSTCLKF